MATLLIRNLNDMVKETIRVRAAQHGRSMVAEARDILEKGVARHSVCEHPYLRVRRAVEKYGGLDLELPPRGRSHQEVPDFSGDEFKDYD